MLAPNLLKEKTGVFVRNVTLCLVVKQKEGLILLGMKKRGFGIGKWNSFGGKVGQDESIEQAAKRELLEESGLQALSLEKVAELEINFPYKPEWDQKGHVFIVKEWRGEPKETEEMSPKWFALEQIPIEKMWDADKYWLGRVLKGEKLSAKFVFEQGEKVAECEIRQL